MLTAWKCSKCGAFNPSGSKKCVCGEDARLPATMPWGPAYWPRESAEGTQGARQC